MKKLSIVVPHFRLHTYLTLFYLLISVLAHAQTTWYVLEGGAGLANGTSWTNATGDLQEAIDSAKAGDEIWVAEGTYYPTIEFDSDGSGGSDAREVTFYINKNIALYGGFSGNESSLSDRDWHLNITILDGNFNTDSDSTNNAYHVLYIDGTSSTNGIDATCQINGFHITAGFAVGSTANSRGAGALINGTDTICSPSFIHCAFSRNIAYDQGGAIFCGGQNGSISPQIIQCQFIANLADQGGAICNRGNGGTVAPLIVNSLFSQNGASQGGAVFNFANNGGTTAPELINVTFFGNSALQGGAVANSASGGTCQARIANSIFWSNGNELANAMGTMTTLTNCILDDGNINGIFSAPSGTTDGGNNLDAYPEFVDSANQDFHLLSTSPAINAGVNDSLPSDANMDLSDANRIIFGTVDIGAYEYFQCPQSGEPIYVDSAAIGLMMTGLNWDSAFTDLQWAIDLACECPVGDGHTPIWVAQGTYYPTRDFDANHDRTFNSSGREKTFYIHKNLKIYGGFSGTEMNLQDRDWNQNPTILSGDLDHDGLLSGANAFHVLYLDGTTLSGRIDSTCTIDGFQVVLGNANGSSVSDNGYGGGALLNGSGQNNICSPIIANCTFNNNKAVTYGGALYNNGTEGNSSPFISNCTFINNSAQDGGAILNRAEEGGLSSPFIENSTFIQNSNNAIFNKAKTDGESHPMIVNSVFMQNYAQFGAAIYTEASQAISSPTIINCSFVNNSSGSGGALYNSVSDGECSLSIINTILWNYGDEIHNIAATSTLTNCIFDDGTPDGALMLPSGTIDGGNNLDAYPLFVDTVNSDVHLLPGSPAINAGVNDGLPKNLVTDLSGASRIIFGTVDMGAYEYFQCPQSPNPIYVDSANTNITLTGLSWDSAFTDLQWAIDLACECPVGDGYAPIWVAQGTYYPTKEFDWDASGGSDVREKTFYIHKNIQLYGGFAGNETDPAERDWSLNTTILSGDLDQDGTLNGENSYHILYIDGTSSTGSIDSTCLLDGFRIVLGNANGSLSDKAYGGGAYIDGSNGHLCQPNIVNCHFKTNSARYDGGAIFNNASGSGVCSPMIINCYFESNSASNTGGAISNYARDAGESSPFISYSIFDNNSALRGGAIYNVGGEYGEASPSIKNSLFSYNSAGYGGAMYNFGSEGWSRPNIINCSFANNTIYYNGPALYNSVWFGTALPNVRNSILYGNTHENGVVDEVYNYTGATAVFTNCIIKGSGGSESWVSSYGTDGGGNLDLDPLFQEVSSGNLQLLPYSPAINSGVNTSLSINDSLDLDGNPRVVDEIVDMGAYENQEGDCPENPVLNERYSPLDGYYPAGTSITIMGEVEISDTGNTVLDAPNVSMEPTFLVTSPGLLEIKQDGCQNGTRAPK